MLVRVNKFCKDTGEPEDTLRGYMKRGIILENVVWFKSPQGKIYIDPEAYESWVKSGQGLQQHQKALSKSRSNTKMSVVESE